MQLLSITTQSNGSVNTGVPEILVHTPKYLIKLWVNLQA